MEIIIKAKQKFNPFFSFLDYKDDLHPYYRHIKELITSGAYTVRQQSPGVEDQKEEAPLMNGSEEAPTGTVEDEANGLGCESKVEAEETDQPAVTVKVVDADEKDSESGISDSEDSESDDEGGYLHPLLMRAMNSKSRTPTPARENSPLPDSVNSSKSEVAHDHSTVTTSIFYTKSYSINSAPSLEPVVDKPKRTTAMTASQSHDTKQQ